jgi:hypothetical protein
VIIPIGVIVSARTGPFTGQIMASYRKHGYLPGCWIHGEKGEATRWCGCCEYPIRCLLHVDRANNATQVLPRNCEVSIDFGTFWTPDLNEETEFAWRHHGDSGMSSLQMASLISHWWPRCPGTLHHSACSAPISHLSANQPSPHLDFSCDSNRSSLLILQPWARLTAKRPSLLPLSSGVPVVVDVAVQYKGAPSAAKNCDLG